MDVLVRKEALEEVKTPAIVLPLFKGKMPNDKGLKAIDKALDGALSGLLKEDVLDAGNYSAIYTNKKLPAKRVVIVGLGDKKKFKRDALRVVAGNLAKHMKAKKIQEFCVYLDFKKEQAYDFTEGLLLGDYSYDEFKTKKDEDKKKVLKSCSILVKNKQEEKKVKKNIGKAVVVADSVILARDLINKPAMIATPEYIAKQAQEISKLPHVSCKILDEKDLKKEKMNLHLGVSAGSPNPPRLVVLHYGKTKKKPIVFVGKGVTFDSGGTNLKPSGYIEDMKTDMGGAAVVLATIKAAAELKLPVNIYGILALTENIIGGKAIKPGDVIRSASGKTVEIDNTDAEGRLILADALNYSLRYKPAEIIDIATLTGATIVALGKKVASVMGDDAMLKKLKKASRATNEKIWRLPTFDEYKEDIKGSVADIKNVGNPKGEAGTIAAGMFLKEFVDDNKWVHVDIGGAVSSPGESGYHAKGTSGFGVRLFVEYLSKGK
ncbi:leucyl aminopeptidase [Thermoproteota archaeon]